MNETERTLLLSRLLAGLASLVFRGIAWLATRTPLAVQLLLAIVLGVVTGEVLGVRAQPLEVVAKLVIQLLKALAGPLVFFAVLDAFARTRIEGRAAIRLVRLSVTNACVAAGIALLLANTLRLGARASGLFEHASAEAPTTTPSRLIERLVPSNLLEPFLTENALSIVLLAVLFGVALRRLPEGEPRVTVERLAEAGFKLVATILGWVVHLVPIAAFCILAKAVGTSGIEVFRSLGLFVALVTFGIVLHAGLYYGVLLWVARGVPPWRFFPQAAEALLTAFSTGSSLATLPVTLRTLDRMKVSPESARLAACVGTNLNHDGILLYEATAALFVAQALGRDLDLPHQVWVVITSTLAAVGIAGIPDAGLITLALVLGSVGLPLEAVSVLFSVDWFLGRLRASANVTSDMVVARLLDQGDRREDRGAQAPGGVQGSRS